MPYNDKPEYEAVGPRTISLILSNVIVYRSGHAGGETRCYPSSICHSHDTSLPLSHFDPGIGVGRIAERLFARGSEIAVEHHVLVIESSGYTAV